MASHPTGTTREVLPHEYALLLDAAKPGRAERTEPRDWDAAQWERVLRLARWHRVSAFLFAHLEPDGVPPDALARLRRTYQANAARYVLISRARLRVLEALDAEGIPVMLLKGVALTEMIYPDPALREMSDVDVLVPEGRLDAANAALGAIGYSRARDVRRVRDTAAWMRQHHLHDPPLSDDDNRVAVELHHHVAHEGARPHFDISDVWSRARTSEVGPTHLVPAGEDLLLHACLHFTHDRVKRSYGSLAQLCDIAWIVNREEIDWAALTTTARAYRVHSSVFLALFAARELGLEIPAEPAEELRPADFQEKLGRRMVALRVLRTEPPLPARSLRNVLAPDRVGLAEAWGADTTSRRSLVAAYLRRGAAGLALTRHAVREPWTVLRDFRLNGQIATLKSRSGDYG